eukprot:UN31295
MHSKLWRPSILLCLQDVDHALIDFCNILKKGGLYIIGHSMIGDFQQIAPESHKIRRQWISWIEQHGYKAFPQVSIGADFRSCYQNLMLLAGLGAMSPSTVVFPFWRSGGDKPQRKMTNPLTEKQVSIFETLNEQLQMKLRGEVGGISKVEWIESLHDVLAMQKNIVISHHFQLLDFNLIDSSKLQEEMCDQSDSMSLIEPLEGHKFLDVWIDVDDYTWDL